MTTKKISIFAIAAILILPIAMNATYAQTVTGSATIEALTCGLTFPNGAGFDFGTLKDGDTYLGLAAINMTNSGSGGSSLSISGEDWKNGTSSVVMLGNQTYYTSNETLEYDSLAEYDHVNAETMPSSNTSWTFVNPLENVSKNVGLKVNLSDSLHIGSMTQVVTIETTCS